MVNIRTWKNAHASHLTAIWSVYDHTWFDASPESHRGVETQNSNSLCMAPTMTWKSGTLKNLPPPTRPTCSLPWGFQFSHCFFLFVYIYHVFQMGSKTIQTHSPVSSHWKPAPKLLTSRPDLGTYRALVSISQIKISIGSHRTDRPTNFEWDTVSKKTAVCVLQEKDMECNTLPVQHPEIMTDLHFQKYVTCQEWDWTCLGANWHQQLAM